MIRIAADTSTLYSIEEGKINNVEIAPFLVTINNKSYRELEEIQAEEFIKIIQEGHLPTSSQPYLAEVLDIYNKYPEDEIINISMGDGLSGTYSGACTAKQMAANSERISVVNTKTICGPHRYLTDLAVKLVQAEKNKSEILEILDTLIKTSTSFVVPSDFGYLVRGGRLSPFIGHIGGLVRLVPVLRLTENGKLDRFAVKRSFSKAIDVISQAFIRDGVDDNYKVTVAHAKAPELADKAKETILTYIPNADIEILNLGPAFITQGGPGCLLIGTIKKYTLD